MTDTEQATTEKAKVTADTDREIHVERVFNAPREKVFAAFTDPELIPQWWGFRSSETIVEKMEVRKGGDWQFLSRSADGTEIRFRGTIREFEPPELISQTFEFDGMPGYVCVDTNTFEDLGDGRTKIKTVSMFFTNEERDGMLSSMEGGVDETYERLDEVLARD